MATTETVASAGAVLDVLDLLFRADYSVGLTPGDVRRELGLSGSAVTRYLATLDDRGAIERISGTDRVRPSIRWAQRAAGILRSLDDAERRAAELAKRITTPAS